MWILHLLEKRNRSSNFEISDTKTKVKLRIPALADCTAKEDDISAYLGFLSSPLLLLMLNFYIFNQVVFFWALFIPSFSEKWQMKSAKVQFVNRWIILLSSLCPWLICVFKRWRVKLRNNCNSCLTKNGQKMFWKQKRHLQGLQSVQTSLVL